ncbi:DoxX family protein [Halobaculum sp. MBLA0147]|uniref:DoxX family protein n=1 Tax=Halobaculum sp. MBLA0147 TaxID=3079934 RepID=UPI003526218D
MTVDAGLGGVLLLVGRVAFGGFLAFAGLNHFLNADQMTGYAASKGIPAPGFGVIASGAMLVLGGLGVLLGVYPVLAAGTLATFFVVATPTMHDFWAVSDAERQSEFTNFTKNVELLGASLVFLALGGQEWAFALGVGVF